MKLLLTNLDGYNKLEDYIDVMVSIEYKFKLLRMFDEQANYRLNFMFIHEFGMLEAFIIPTNIYIHEITNYFNKDFRSLTIHL